VTGVQTCALPIFYPNLDRADKVSVALYHFIRDEGFDTAYISLENGLPHFSVTAKQTGVFKNSPELVVMAQQPLLWKLEANKSFISSKEQISIDHMEKTSVEHCDRLISSTKNLLNWMKKSDWKLPAKKDVLPPLLPLEWRSNSNETPKGSKKNRIDEIVHIGGTENKDGLMLFCDSMDALAETGLKDVSVSVIGSFGKVYGEHSGGMVLRRSGKWPFRLKLLPKLDESKTFEYLRSRNCLVVFTNTTDQLPMPLLACLEEGIPFVVSEGQSIELLVNKEGKNSAICSADARAIAKNIRRMMKGSEAKKVEPKYSQIEKKDLWNKIHDGCFKVKKNVKPSKKRKKNPLVSIILAHYNRPDYLSQAVASVKRLDYDNIELIVVDDGSKSKAAIKLLDQMEPDFAKRGWKIIRQKNKFLGAARNRGIRESKGERILFLDDDNALFPECVSVLVRAMDKSGADLCTTFARLLYERSFVPMDTSTGYIHYFPLGGPLDISMINNPYGDANALFRREVFDRIGYMNEMRGLSTSDWELFLRADLAGLKIAVVPEALYWYRSDPEGMNRNAQWYKNRMPIIDAIKKHKFKGLNLFYQLGIHTNADLHEIDTNLWNLQSRATDERYTWLGDKDPNSTECIDLLCEIAAGEGRPDTAVELLGHTGRENFQKRAIDTIQGQYQQVLPELSSELFKEHTVPSSAYNLAHVGTSDQSEILSYTETSPDQLYLEAKSQATTVAVLKRACPKGTMSASGWGYLPEAITEPAEFLLVLVPTGADPFAAIDQADHSVQGHSCWKTLTEPHESREFTAELDCPSNQAMDMVLAIRTTSESEGKKVLGGFAGIKYLQAVGTGTVRHPKRSAPQKLQRARVLSEEEVRKAVLTTQYPSELPLLLFPSDNGGIFLRPMKKGPVVATLVNGLPPYARRVTAKIEITHEEASPFEFAIALTNPGETLNWRRGQPNNALAFSGWTLISDKFELKELSVSLNEASASNQAIHLAIRLPRGSSPSPANAFWRQLIISWD